MFHVCAVAFAAHLWTSRVVPVTHQRTIVCLSERATTGLASSERIAGRARQHSSSTLAIEDHGDWTLASDHVDDRPGQQTGRVLGPQVDDRNVWPGRPRGGRTRYEGVVSCPKCLQRRRWRYKHTRRANPPSSFDCDISAVPARRAFRLVCRIMLIEHHNCVNRRDRRKRGASCTDRQRARCRLRPLVGVFRNRYACLSQVSSEP